MGRQRIISDSFWTDPDLINLTTEDRMCLVLMMTNQDTNIIGIYRTVWRVVGAGMGWSEAQTLLAARDLMAKGHVEIDEATGWVWVKEWWKHNYIRGAFVGNVKGKALKEMSQIPEKWKRPAYESFLRFDEDGTVAEALSVLTASESGAAKGYNALFGQQPLEEIGSSLARIPYRGHRDGLPSTSQGAPGNHTPNHIFTPISTTTQGNGLQPGGGDFEQVSLEDLVNAALWAAEKGKTIKNVGGYRRKVRNRLLEQGPNRTDFETLSAWRNAVEKATSRDDHAQKTLAQQEAANAEIAAKYRAAQIRFEALAADDRQVAIDEFKRCVVERSATLQRFYAKQGLVHKAVHAAFIQFFSDANRGDSA
ncbi:hypothetical protein PMI40_03218 [Herbaspirillum sp. YR522]|nr:hypothetical protein PMI40_03218 [Herbaspirillum sp. YR522]